MVEKGQKVRFICRCFLENGEEIAKAHSEIAMEVDPNHPDPLEANIAQALLGMQVDTSKKLTLNPEEAYGHYDPQKRVQVDTARLPSNAKEGDVLSVDMEEKGVKLRKEAYVKSMDPNIAILDLNHPLAGRKLTFELSLKEIDI